MSAQKNDAAGQAQTARRIVIVGAGECGTRTALQLRQLGWDGELTLIGNESEVPYERPTLSKGVLTNGSAPPTITTTTDLATQDITWRSGVAATRIDRKAKLVELADGTTVSYDRLLLATGSRARHPAVDEPELVQTLRSSADATRLRDQLTPGARALVIGGGFIGLEVAASAVELGCNVTVVEFAHRLMSRVVPAKVASVLENRHLEAGVDLRCGISVNELQRSGNNLRVLLSDGSSLACDVAIAGVGAVPNVELAAAAGLMITDGIAVDDHLCTDDPDIFAAGDCCSFPHPIYGGQRIRLEAWRNALEQAEIAARNLIGGSAVCETVPWFWSEQYELGLQIAGLHAEAAYDVVRSRTDGTEIRFGLDTGGRVVSASGVAEGTAIARDIRVAEMLIARRATPTAALLANSAVNLRELLVD
jgi:3-phenylpropionate/trans-cinnamate dioxygenase ferredoxin reductase component